MSLYASNTFEGTKPTSLVKQASAVSYLRTRALNIKQDYGVPIFAGDSTVKLSFQECEFENNTLPLRIEVVPGAKVYSDNRTELVWQDVADSDPVQPQSALPLSEAEASGFFLSMQDPEYIALKNVRPTPHATSTCMNCAASGDYISFRMPHTLRFELFECMQGMPLESPGANTQGDDSEGGGGGDGLSDGAKIGIGVSAAALALLAAGMAGFWFIRRRSARSGARPDACKDAPASGKHAVRHRLLCCCS